MSNQKPKFNDRNFPLLAMILGSISSFYGLIYGLVSMFSVNENAKQLYQYFPGFELSVMFSNSIGQILNFWFATAIVMAWLKDPRGFRQVGLALRFQIIFCIAMLAVNIPVFTLSSNWSLLTSSEAGGIIGGLIGGTVGSVGFLLVLLYLFSKAQNARNAIESEIEKGEEDDSQAA